MELAKHGVPVPTDAIRAVCPAIALAKAKDWAGVDAWMRTASAEEIMQIAPDTHCIRRNTLLHAFSTFIGPVDRPNCPIYARAKAAVVSTWANKGLLDLKGGPTDQPALCSAASCGNYVMCKLLLESGASTPLPVILSPLPPSRTVFLYGAFYWECAG